MIDRFASHFYSHRMPLSSCIVLSKESGLVHSDPLPEVSQTQPQTVHTLQTKRLVDLVVASEPAPPSFLSFDVSLP